MEQGWIKIRLPRIFMPHSFRSFQYLLRAIDSFRIFYCARQFWDKFNCFSPGFMYWNWNFHDSFKIFWLSMPDGFRIPQNAYKTVSDFFDKYSPLESSSASLGSCPRRHNSSFSRRAVIRSFSPHCNFLILSLLQTPLLIPAICINYLFFSRYFLGHISSISKIRLPASDWK